MNYDRRPEDLSKEIVDTVSTTADISGKSIRALYNAISLLKNLPEIRTAIVPPLSGLNRMEGTLPVYRVYNFFADCYEP
ncbi:MAG: hypothetical protein NTX75_04450 [Proteobacteria bacterium]|nr:hypothetical protein [Pseudomonadota bacterium]